MANNYFQIFFQSGQIARWLIDFEALHLECENLRRLELSDLDAYLSAERQLQEKGVALLQSLAVNTSMLALFAVKSETDFKLRMPSLFSTDKTDILRKVTSLLLHEKKNACFEAQLSQQDKGRLYFTVYMDFLPEEGKHVAMLSFVDITEERYLISQLQESMEKYRMLITAANDAIILIDCAMNKILEVNPQAVILFSRQPESMVGSDHALLYPKEERATYRRYYQQQLQSEDNAASLDTAISGGDGELVPVQIHLASAEIGERRVALVTFHDLRNRLKLEERRRLLATAVEQAAESIMITDLSGTIEYVNPAFEEVSGYDITEVVGRSPKMLRSSETSRMETNLMWQEISKGQVWRGTFTNRRKDGSLYKEEATITPVKDGQGAIRHYVAVKRDITRQLTLENQVRQSQKMQAIGTLAGGVAHDFNNILTAILGYAELSQALSQENTVLHDNLGEVIRGAERAGKLINQILQFSRQSEKSVSTLQIDLIVNEVLKLLRASLPANIEIIANLAKGAMVKADPTQMHQVVLNLCTNAFQVLEETGGEIKVGLEEVVLTPRQGLEIGNLSPGAYVCITVEDNGKGIPKEYISRIFEPYFTTKPQNEGTGLGLSVVHGIVNDHRGAVKVESTVGKGTKFSLYIPAADPEEDDWKVDGKLSVFKGGRILIVDDEPQIVSLQSQVLEHLGYEVVSSTVSKEALQIFQQADGNFDLVITDMGMPEMTGLELFERIQELQPQTKVLLCTGYSKLVTRENAEELGLAGYLAKPFNAEDLAYEVGRILE
ncbi:PAS domain-containing hybrid sensor histidine kinase/response regulator [Desulfogranum marinum]|uniref:PAS domain-containing hybrid sensor histidine kinase/response regulator n=2 Tax=Desulfogranum marinum TaxID=453220 RepID=UPI001964B989|nr:PAS domain-containing sensor histidine kinase [Desulfogranum marinum]MBM9510757.1 PAS domain S-box protein [Desulfogranum marinum]